MANIKNIIGNKYGKLTVLELIDRNDKSKTRYLCKCECGNLIQTLIGYCIYTLLANRKIMWIRTANGIEWIEVEQTAQGLWIPKKVT